MFFTHVCYVLAWLLFVPSALLWLYVTASVSGGDAFAFTGEIGDKLLASQDTFLQGAAIGLAMGIVAEAGYALTRRRATA